MMNKNGYGTKRKLVYEAKKKWFSELGGSDGSESSAQEEPLTTDISPPEPKIPRPDPVAPDDDDDDEPMPGDSDVKEDD